MRKSGAAAAAAAEKKMCAFVSTESKPTKRNFAQHITPFKIHLQFIDFIYCQLYGPTL